MPLAPSRHPGGPSPSPVIDAEEPTAAAPHADSPKSGGRGLLDRLRWVVGGEPQPDPDPVVSAFDALPDPTLIVGADGRIQRASQAVGDVLGHSPAELVEADAVETLFPTRYQEAVRSALQPDAEPTPTRAVALRQDGGELPVDVHVRPTGRGAFVATLRDARADRSADARRRTLRTIVDAVPDRVVAIDHVGRVVLRNQAHKDARSADGSDLSPKQMQEARAAMESGQPSSSVEPPDATGRIDHVTRVPVQDRAGSVVGVVVIARDVTAQKQAEEKLRTDKQAAEAAAQANRQVLATTSHEVRTLMSGVTGMTALLLGTDLDEEQHDFVSTIETSSHALLSVVNDVLDLSKIEAGHLELEEHPFEPRQVVREALDMVVQQGAEKGLEMKSAIASTVPEAIVGDATRVRQVLVNLLTNAVKFTERGSVRVCVVPRSGDRLEIAVEDTGMGIAPDRLKAVFEQYTQADASTARTHGGTGLGLTICRRLAEAMEGGLTAESTPGEGSVFRFVIPLRTSEGEATPTPARSGAATPPTSPLPAASGDGQAPDGPRAGGVVMSATSILPSARVLLAEDNPTMQKVTALTLKRLGYRPEVVDNGRKAVVSVRSKAYDVVLMDIMMPVMDGLEATRQIREDHGRHPAPAIVALTANAMEGDRERCIRAGCDDYLSKPVDPRHLAATIEQAISQRADAEAGA